ncbi:MAG TPA: hypothetical protein VK437_13320 [Steroidobacteraceae bacterium]|nr:hypothetical protein [Steroidobacteraceae bacterium]
MRIKIITLAGLLAFSAGTAVAQTPAQAAQDVQQYNQDIQQLNQDVRNNVGDMRKDQWDAAHDRRDIDRDDTLRNADKLREERDLAAGNLKGAEYWNQQRKDENAEIRHDKRDLAHSLHDIRNDNRRLAKDVKVRHHDIDKRNRAARKV